MNIEQQQLVWQSRAGNRGIGSTLEGRLFVIGVSAAMVLGCSSAFAADPSPCPVAGDAVITNVLVSIRQKYDVPAICAARVTSQGLSAFGVAGVRKRGTTVPATLDDLWHLGSDTKAMTAMLLATFVEELR